MDGLLGWDGPIVDRWLFGIILGVLLDIEKHLFLYWNHYIGWVILNWDHKLCYSLY